MTFKTVAAGAKDHVWCTSLPFWSWESWVPWYRFVDPWLSHGTLGGLPRPSGAQRGGGRFGRQSAGYFACCWGASYFILFKTTLFSPWQSISRHLVPLSSVAGLLASLAGWTGI